MSDITTGTVNATPLGDLWIGTVEHASGSLGDVIGLKTLVGEKIAGVLWASEDVGTAAGSACATVSSSSGSVTLTTTGGTKLFFVARSSTQ